MPKKDKDNDVVLFELLAKKMSNTPCSKTLTMQQAQDCVTGLRLQIGLLEEGIDGATNHLDDCSDDECNRQVKEDIEYMKWRKNMLVRHLEEIATPLARQKEALEFTLARTLGFIKEDSYYCDNVESKNAEEDKV